MIIDLAKEMEEHYKRVQDLADEAAQDSDQGFTSRSSAMTACSTMLVQLTKAQESLITMERLHKVEQVITDTVKEYLSDNDMIEILDVLEQRLEALS